MVNDKEFMEYICSLNQDEKIALLASTSEDFPAHLKFYSGIQGKHPVEKPAANILHQVNTIREEMTMYLNYKPTNLELGMMWRAGEIHNAYYVKSRDPIEIGQFEIDQNGFREKIPCDLNEITTLTQQEKESFEAQDQRLKEAMQRPANSREISREVSDALRRGTLKASFEALENESNKDLESMSERKINEDFIRIVSALVHRGWNSEDGHTKPEDRIAGNNIGALMVDKNHRIIAWGLNLKRENKTFHAETLMILNYLKENNLTELPEGVKIYTSLECCHMCAGHITDFGKDVKVIFAQKDPYFEGENVLAQGVNGCSQQVTTLPIKEVLHDLIEDQENILSFLFSNRARQTFSKSYKHAAILAELVSAVAERKKNKDLALDLDLEEQDRSLSVSPIMVIGESFLEELTNFAPPTPSIQPSFFRSIGSSASSSRSNSPVKEADEGVDSTDEKRPNTR